MLRILSASICILMVCIFAAGAFLFGGCGKGKEERADCGASMPAEICLKQHLGLVLPEDARNVKCHVEALMVQWVFARFDVSPSILPGLLSLHPLDRLPPLSENPYLQKELQVDGAEIPWWQVPAGEGATVSQSSWSKTEQGSDWECTLSICVERRADVATLYLVYSEEPVFPGTATENDGQQGGHRQQ